MKKMVAYEQPKLQIITIREDVVTSSGVGVAWGWSTNWDGWNTKKEDA